MRYLKTAIMLFTAILVLTIIGFVLYFSIYITSQKSNVLISDLYFSNEQPLENETIYITIKMANYGSASQFVNLYLYANEKLIKEEEIFLVGGKTTSLKTEHSFYKGFYIIKAKIVPKNILIEETEYNKTIEKQLRVFSLNVDLTPSLILFSTNTPEVNSTVKITAIISNIGGANAENISFKIENETEIIKEGKIAFISAKNGREELSANWTVKKAGIDKIKIIVNTSLIEDNTSNNELVQSIIVYSELPMPDFAVLSEEIFVEDAVEKYNSTIKIKVHNIGNKNANAIVKFFADDLVIGEINKTILRKSYEEINMIWIPNSSKFYNISIKVENFEDNNNKNNNAEKKNVYVKTMPNVVVENITLKENIKEGELINIFIELHNLGEGDAENFLVEIKENEKIFSYERVSLIGKERKTISVLWFANADINKIEVILNSDNSLIEGRKDDNSKSISLIVEKKVDYSLFYAVPIIFAIFIIFFVYLKSRKKAVYSVEEVFLIYKDGRLISHKGKSSVDDELMSSMLTAIQDFVRDSFKAKGKIDEIQYGSSRILIQHPPYDDYFSYVYLAVLINGKEDLVFKRGMMNLVVEVHKKFSALLKNWDGDLGKLSEIDLIVEEFYKKSISKL